MHWFAMVASLSPTVSVMKAGFLVVDVFCVGLIARIGMMRNLGLLPAWLYALHPLPVVGFVWIWPHGWTGNTLFAACALGF